jgi:LysM repeat protein
VNEKLYYDNYHEDLFKSDFELYYQYRDLVDADNDVDELQQAMFNGATERLNLYNRYLTQLGQSIWEYDPGPSSPADVKTMTGGADNSTIVLNANLVNNNGQLLAVVPDYEVKRATLSVDNLKLDFLKALPDGVSINIGNKVRPTRIDLDNTATIPYEVQPDDTLWEIAKNHNTDVATLAFRNNIKNKDEIEKGQILKIPRPRTETPSNPGNALTTSSNGKIEGSLYISNNYLTKEQMKVNARYIYDYLTNRGWSKEAICAVLGNMQTESNINPGIWEGLDDSNIKGGFGLVQWTPSNKYIKWAKDNGLGDVNMDSQLKRILYEVERDDKEPNSLQWQNKNMNFRQFTQSTDSVETLANVFMNSYERPYDSDQPKRGEQARYWYNFFK